MLTIAKTFRTSGSRIIRRFCFGTIALLTPFACARNGPTSETPIASLATSAQAQEAFQSIRRRWALDSWEDRQKLEPRLWAFRSRFSTDPLARVADAYLAMLTLERGNLVVAEALVRNAETLPPGNTRDLARVVQAAILGRTGKAGAALNLLAPITGKLLDPFAQNLAREVIIECGLQASRWDHALATMDEWLRHTEGQEQDALKVRIYAYLDRFPTEVLERELHRLREKELRHSDIRNAIAHRLGQVALQLSDPRLARTVVEENRAAAAAGTEGRDLARLASMTSGVPRVIGATVGLAMPESGDRTRARATEVIAGLVHVLGPQDSRASHRPVSLVVRGQDATYHSKPRQRFEALVEQGVSLLFAGFDPESADEALSFAEEEAIPTVLFVAPTQWPSDVRYAFVLGTSEDVLVQGPLAAARESGAAKLVWVGPSRTSPTDVSVSNCRSQSPRAGENVFPTAAWKRDRVDAIAVAAPTWCANDLVRELSSAKLSPLLVCGPTAVPACEVWAASRKALSAQSEAFGSNSHGTAHEASLEAWRTQQGRFPSWFESLGRDAGMLAREAMQGLPTDIAVVADEIVKRRSSVRLALEKAKTDLWTTHAMGFQGARLIPRNIVYRSPRVSP